MRLASEYFKPERRGHKSDYYSLGDKLIVAEYVE